MKSTNYNSWRRSRSRILYGVIFFVMIGLCLTYFKRPKDTTPEAAPAEQSSGKTSLELFDERSDVHAKYQHTANKDLREEDPSEQNFQSLRYAMQRDADKLTFITHPDGSKSVNLNGTFRTVTAARRLPDGTLEISCFENFEDLENFVDTSKL